MKLSLQTLAVLWFAATAANADLAKDLTDSGYKIVCEAYDETNGWDLFVMNADGAGKTNLTTTKGEHEMYPQVSPDGKRVAFVCDVGEGRELVRSVHVMDIDGKNRKLVSSHAREPFWHPNSKTLGFLPQEYKKFNNVDYFTKGISFYDVGSGKTTPHPHSDKFHHLYNPGFSAGGKWIASTVHAGMGFDHAILLFQPDGDKIINLEIPGCRPSITDDNKHICWGTDDHTIALAKIDLTADEPKVGERVLTVKDKTNKIYHSDTSPGGEFLTVSRGVPSDGDLSKKGTHEGACEMIGVYAKGWDIFAVPIGEAKEVDLLAEGAVFANLTKDGASNKESDWFKPAK